MIVVTGSAGFIGSSLFIKLLERGDKLMIIDKENDQIKFVNNNLKIKHLIPKSIN